MAFDCSLRQTGYLGQFFIGHGFMMKKCDQGLVDHRQPADLCPENSGKFFLKNQAFRFTAQRRNDGDDFLLKMIPFIFLV